MTTVLSATVAAVPAADESIVLATVVVGAVVGAVLDLVFAAVVIIIATAVVPPGADYNVECHRGSGSGDNGACSVGCSGSRRGALITLTML
jgi:hypothetical protein